MPTCHELGWPRLLDRIWHFPVHHVRGGTSTGLILSDENAPGDIELREELLRHLMGVPLSGTHLGNRQSTGLGRIFPTSNKVFFASCHSYSDDRCRIVSTLAQLASERAAIDWSVNCGNLSSALLFWAADCGMLNSDVASVEAEIFNTNTSRTITANAERSEDGQWALCEIPGIRGNFPSVDLKLEQPAGAKTGHLLPTRKPIDDIDGIGVSCVDCAVPMAIVRASDLGKTGTELIEELESDSKFMSQLRELWIKAGRAMRLMNKAGRLLTPEELAESETIPKICLVTHGQQGHITARYFTPQRGHSAMAVTGGCCLASACLIPGTTANLLAQNLADLKNEAQKISISIDNPSGVLDTYISAFISNNQVNICSASYRRSAQILISGYVPLYRASPELNAALHSLYRPTSHLAPSRAQSSSKFRSSVSPQAAKL